MPKKSKKKFEDKIKRLTNRNWGVSMGYRIHKLNQSIQEWSNYFRVGDIKGYASYMDGHIRRRLRACQWKQWKKLRTKYPKLKNQGISPLEAWKCANTRKGYWCLSKNPILHMALNNKYWENLKLKSILI